MQKYKLFGLAPPIWVAQYIYSIDIQRIIKCESKRCQSQENKDTQGDDYKITKLKVPVLFPL